MPLSSAISAIGRICWGVAADPVGIEGELTIISRVLSVILSSMAPGASLRLSSRRDTHRPAAYQLGQLGIGKEAGIAYQDLLAPVYQRGYDQEESLGALLVTYLRRSVYPVLASGIFPARAPQRAGTPQLGV